MTFSGNTAASTAARGRETAASPYFPWSWRSSRRRSCRCRSARWGANRRARSMRPSGRRDFPVVRENHRPPIRSSTLRVAPACLRRPTGTIATPGEARRRPRRTSRWSGRTAAPSRASAACSPPRRRLGRMSPSRRRPAKGTTTNWTTSGSTRALRGGTGAWCGCTRAARWGWFSTRARGGSGSSAGTTTRSSRSPRTPRADGRLRASEAAGRRARASGKSRPGGRWRGCGTSPGSARSSRSRSDRGSATRASPGPARRG
mmetsp:Transcript_1921/g.8468  ORF Transcript_1921/g.8468 Transcript_1921/m.8468 type:complete len:260 (+) Transcript_1921:137-916(+)